jgi:hypothetical protein
MGKPKYSEKTCPNADDATCCPYAKPDPHCWKPASNRLSYGTAFRVPVGARIFSSSRRPDRLWGPPSLLFNVFFINFLIGIMGGGVQLGPLGTAVTNRPTVPAPGDYDDAKIGGMFGRGNRSTRRKPVPMPLCPPQTPHAYPEANPGRRGGKPATNRLSYGTAFSNDYRELFSRG